MLVFIAGWGGKKGRICANHGIRLTERERERGGGGREGGERGDREREGAAGDREGGGGRDGL